MSELDDRQKQTLVQNFIFNSPPGQTGKVVENVTTLVGKELLAPHLDGMVKRVNKESFLAVRVPGQDEPVLLTAAGELGNGNFLDPNGKQQLIVDHVQQKCTGVEPLSAEDFAALEPAEAVRLSVDGAMQRYARDKLPGAVVTTYGQKSNGKCKVTCCMGRINMNLGNYWAGAWRSEWVLEVTDGEREGHLGGSIKCKVHYFEDGNVQLHDSTTCSTQIPLQGDVGAAFSKHVASTEAGFISSFEEIFVTMSTDVLNGLRRRLPKTKVKFDWDNRAATHKLGKDLQNLNAK